MKFRENGFVTSEERSRLMAKIKAKDTKPEWLLRRALWTLGLRYRIHNKKLPGTPDITIKKYKLAIFVDGSFWHGHNWHERKPKLKNNKEYWIDKIERNRQRDVANTALLQSKGYKVFRFWDFEVEKNIGICIRAVLEYIDFRKHHSFYGE